MIDSNIKKANILIVDDQPANIAILEGFLEMQGYENVASTLDPRDVLQLFATFEPDLILLDLMMPYLTGFEVMEQLKPLIPEGTFLPILVLTADATSDAKQKALSGGASDFLTKPFDLTEVGLRIHNLLYTNMLQKQLLNQNQILEGKVKERTNELELTNKELILARDKAMSLDKLKTSFIQNISHEIRTPLNGILGFGGLLADPDYSVEERQEFIDMLKASSERLMNTVTDYMDISLIVSNLIQINKKPFDAYLVLENLHYKFQPKCQEKGLELVLRTPDQIESLTINNDQELFTKIFTHLLDNAVKFTKQGQISFGFEPKGDFIEFFIIDSGIGISSEAHERVFEMFMQEDSSTTRGHEGSGLGLSISHGFLKLMGGNIRLESEKNKGTTIILNLPVNADQPLIEHPKNGHRKPNDNPLVLIAEDDDSNRIFFELVLKQHNAQLLMAENGQEAVELAKANPEIDVILMDLKMPVMDGQTATKLIRQFNPDVPIIAVTAYTMDNEYIRTNQEGFSAFLAKPTGKNELLRSLQKFGLLNSQS